jgi:hypothetical protein
MLDVQLHYVLCAHYRHAARTMMPFAPGAAALRASVNVIKELVATGGGDGGEAAFAATLTEDLISLVRSVPQGADDSSDAAALAVTRNLKELIGIRFSEQSLTCADAESHMHLLQVVFIARFFKSSFSIHPCSVVLFLLPPVFDFCADESLCVLMIVWSSHVASRYLCSLSPTT